MGALIQGEIISEHTTKDSSILSIVDRDIQAKIIDSPSFHADIKRELKDIKRRKEGISDEDYEKMLKKEEEEEISKPPPEKEGYNYKLKHNRVTKPPKFNLPEKTKPKDFHLMY